MPTYQIDATYSPDLEDPFRTERIEQAPVVSPGEVKAVDIQNFIDTYGAVRLSAGPYTFDEPFALQGEGDTMFGSGAGQTVISWSGTEPLIHLNRDGENSFNELAYLTIRGFGAQSQDIAYYPLQIGSENNNAVNANIHDVEFKTLGNGMLFWTSQVCIVERCRFVGIINHGIATANGAVPTGMGFSNEGSNYSQNHTTVRDCVFRNCKNHVNLGRAKRWSFYGNDFETCREESIYLSGVEPGGIYQILFEDNWFENINTDKVFRGVGEAPANRHQQDYAWVYVGSEDANDHPENIQFIRNNWGGISDGGYHAFVDTKANAVFRGNRATSGMRIDWPQTAGFAPDMLSPNRVSAAEIEGFGSTYEVPDSPGSQNANLPAYLADTLIVNPTTVHNISRMQYGSMVIGQKVQIFVKPGAAVGLGLIHTASGDQRLSLPNGSNISGTTTKGNLLEFTLLQDVNGAPYWRLTNNTPPG